MKREKICRTDQQDEAENVPEEKKGGCGPALLAGFIFLAAAGCGAGFLPKFEKMAKEALKPYRISITMTLLDPFYLILLLGSEKRKRWKEMEPVLVMH